MLVLGRVARELDEVPAKPDFEGISLGQAVEVSDFDQLGASEVEKS
jgi:hypothetical protein